MCGMNTIKRLRERLGVTQTALGEAIGCTQGNIGHYEQGQTMPPLVARKFINFAKTKGVVFSFDDIYAPDPDTPKRAKDVPAAGADQLRVEKPIGLKKAQIKLVQPEAQDH